MILSKHNFTKNKLRTMLRHLNRRGSKRDHLSAFNSVQFTLYYTFFFNVDDVVCPNNAQGLGASEKKIILYSIFFFFFLFRTHLAPVKQ